MTRTTSPSAVPTARKVGATKKSSFPVLSEAELTKEFIRPFCLSEISPGQLVREPGDKEFSRMLTYVRY